jgi:predicted RNase H-like HicB family nuclease
MSTARHPAANVAVDPHAPPIVLDVLVKVRALAFPEPDGGYSVIVPEIAGCVTEGDSIEDVEHMVRDLADTLLAIKHDAIRDEAIREFNAPLPGERP